MQLWNRVGIQRMLISNLSRVKKFILTLIAIYLCHINQYVHGDMGDMRDITNVSYRGDVSKWKQLEQAANKRN